MERRDGARQVRGIGWWPRRAWMREARRTNNPLLRRPDGAERAVAWLGLAAMMAAAVTLLLLSMHVYAQGSATERREAATSVPARATITSQPLVPASEATTLVPALATVEYTWHGVPQQGLATVADTALPGDRLTVWVDSRGRLTGQPRGHAQTVFDALEAGMLGVIVVTLLGYQGWRGYRGWTMKRRGAQWDSEWRAFVADGPGQPR